MERKAKLFRRHYCNICNGIDTWWQKARSVVVLNSPMCDNVSLSEEKDLSAVRIG